MNQGVFESRAVESNLQSPDFFEVTQMLSTWAGGGMNQAVASSEPTPALGTPSPLARRWYPGLFAPVIEQAPVQKLPGRRRAARAPSFRSFTESRQLDEGGGDFFVMSEHDGVVHIAIGDVCGHGASASKLMGVMERECMRLASTGLGARRWIEALNGFACTVFPDDLFVTAACVTLDVRRRQVKVANAGHVVPIVRRGSGAVELMGRASGPPLGITRWHGYTEEEFAIHGDDIFVLMTDGAVDTLDDDVEEMSAIVDLVKRSAHCARSILERLVNEASALARQCALDDRTFVAVEPIAASPAARSIRSLR